MSTPSMSVESLQFLLQHMDANRRFEIFNRCPSLRAKEQSVSLKIKSLVFRENCVILNGTTYELGIIRKYNDGETPDYVTATNKKGGVPYEVDRYDIRNELDALTVTPGDVEIQSGDQWIENEDARITRLENAIQFHEGQLAEQRERRPNQNQTTVNRLEKTIELARATLLAYQCRRDDIPPNYEHFLQLTTSRKVDKQELKTIQRYNHNKKYSEAMKQLATALFGGRSKIYVTKFQFSSSLGVIRLPVGVKFCIDQLMFIANVGPTLNALTPIIHESSYPLKKLVIGLLSVDDANHPIVKTAGILRMRVVLTNIVQYLSTITNPVVQVTTFSPDENLEELIANWIASKRPIGTEYTIHFCGEFHCANEIADILKRLNSVPIDDENVIIPMTDTTNLKVSYGPFPEFAPYSKWAVKLLTEAVEH